MKRFKGDLGKEYHFSKLISPHYDSMRYKVGRIIADHDSKTILDLGCGSGYSTQAILLANPNASVVAVDNEPAMIKQAKINLKDYKKRLDIVEEDALKYLQSLKSESFDACASGFTIHNFRKEYRNNVLEEIYRVLKRKGLFVNADKYVKYNLNEHSIDFNLRLERIDSVFTALQREDLKQQWLSHYMEDNQPENLMHEKDSITEMETLGFTDLQSNNHQELEVIISGIKQ
jgi:tRNA (cmo5U34)-methyltransferase